MSSQLNIIFIGTYPPRKCGIATFTSDLANAVASETESEDIRIIAMHDTAQGYKHPSEVIFEIQRNNAQDYQLAADYINFSDTDIVCLQHEFGIFGGTAGEYLTRLISNIKKPIITTLHTILREPHPEYRKSMDEVIRYSHKLVVMNEMGRKILKDVYGVAHEKIELIYHGVPDIPYTGGSYLTEKLNLDGKTLMLTFGFINPGKGIEVALDALPAVVEKYPDIVYIILGATHPEVKKSHGEKYRISLENKVHDLRLENNVIFINRFVTIKELCEYISASDFYISPYSSPEQITSGALAYAIGAGKAIISTPYLYAKEMLSDGRGILVDFRDSKAISEGLILLMDNPVEFEGMRKKAYEFGRQMTWKEVGQQYVELFEYVLKHKSEYAGVKGLKALTYSHATLPAIKLDHLNLLTDYVGIFQHSCFGVPDRSHGYSSDDVGRGLAIFTTIYEKKISPGTFSAIATQLSFLKHSQTKNGNYHNFMGYDKKFLDTEGGEDTLGRVTYGLGHVIRTAPTDGMCALAEEMIGKSEYILGNLHHPRAKAYTICGLYEALKRKGKDSYRNILIKLSDELVELYEMNSQDDWDWFEPVVTYGNAKICEALLHAFQVTHDPRYKEVGLNTLQFLTDVQYNGKFFDHVGNTDWYRKGEEKALFGQQPIDAGYLTETYVIAYEITGDNEYLHLARHAFEWFLGRNRLGVPLYDFTTGAASDGLDAHGANANQGAESTICFLLGLLSLYRHTPEILKEEGDSIIAL